MRVAFGRVAASAIGLSLTVAFAIPGCGDGKERKSIEEALAANPEDELLKNYKPKPKPRPNGLPPPTAAELKAWDRKDPEGEKHLYKWDKKNLSKMINYWNELECYREKIKAEGSKAFGVEPGTPEEEQWYQFKQIFIPQVDQWQKRLFATEPRILEKSKFIGNLLEAHEQIIHGYPKAYNDSDKVELEKVDLHWEVLVNKNTKYHKQLVDKDWPKEDLTDPKVKEKHDKFCVKALEPKKQKQRDFRPKGKRKAKKLDM